MADNVEFLLVLSKINFRRAFGVSVNQGSSKNHFRNLLWIFPLGGRGQTMSGLSPGCNSLVFWWFVGGENYFFPYKFDTPYFTKKFQTPNAWTPIGIRSPCLTIHICIVV